MKMYGLNCRCLGNETCNGLEEGSWLAVLPSYFVCFKYKYKSRAYTMARVSIGLVKRLSIDGDSKGVHIR